MTDDETHHTDNLAAFEARLIASAPRPRPEFEQALGEKLMSELHTRNVLTTPAPQRRFAPRRVWVIFAAVLVLIGAGVVVAINGYLPQILQFDPSLLQLYQQGGGQEINLSQTHDGFTVSLDWAYMDGNRLALAATLQGREDEAYFQFGLWEYELKRQDTQAKIPFFMGMSGLLDDNGEINYTMPQSPSPREGQGFIFYMFDLSGAVDDLIAQNVEILELEATLKPKFITAFDETGLSQEARMAQWAQHQEKLDAPFTFTFSLALDNRQRVLVVDQTATDQDVAITLERVVISPSQTRFTLCFTPPDPARSWTVIPHLSNNTGDIIGGAMLPVDAPDGQICQSFPHQTTMLDYTGAWQIRVSEAIGFGSSGADQVRISGDWQFNFTVPPLE